MSDMTTDADKRDKALEVRLNGLARETFDYGGGVAVIHTTRGENPPAPAWYYPKTGEAFIHLGEAGYDGTGKTEPIVTGLMFHELAHSRWSDWMMKLPKKMDNVVSDVITFIEEMRIEQRMVNAKGHTKPYLRAALPLVMGERHVPETKYDAARLWALVYGRAITTVASEDEVKWVDETARTIIGDDDVEYLTDLLQEGIETRNPLDDLPRIAEEWIATVGRPPKTEGGGCSHDPDGEPGESTKTPTEGADGDGDGGSDDDGDDETETTSMDTGKVDATPDDVDRPDKTGELISLDDGELLKKLADRVASDVSEEWNATPGINLANPQELAAKVFGGSKRAPAFVGRKPDAGHHNQVVKTAKVLENLVIPSISKVDVASQLPPGRLRTREAVRASAERESGMMVSAKPWRGTKRTHTHSRPIVIGIATDVSGSMRWAERAVAEFAYIWSNAGRRVGARTAAVTFGDSCQHVTKPGEILSEIWTRPANGGTEVADYAFAALDGVLKFSHADGASKVLVVVSDGHLVRMGESERVIERFKQFKKAGTRVIWVTPTKSTLTTQLSKMGLATTVHVERLTKDTPKILEALQETTLKAISNMKE